MFATLLLILVYFWHGLYALETLVLGAALTPPYVIVIWIGSRLFRGVSEVFFRRLAFALVMVMGIVALLR